MAWPCSSPRLKGATGISLRWKLLVAVWSVLVVTGSAMLAKRAYGAGEDRSVSRWPERSALPLSRHGPTLVMFLHPKCECSEASLGELERLLARTTAPLETVLVFCQPSELHPEWQHSALRKRAERLPGVLVVTDVDGKEASRFGAVTSGQVLLFSSRGERFFAGGITSARGHWGVSRGELAVLEWAAGHPAAKAAPVFGCGLWTSGGGVL